MSLTSEAFQTKDGENNMEENSKEYYMVKAKEYETESHYLAEILKNIIAESNYSNTTINALARAGYNAYTEKRKSLKVEGKKL